jgi:hypothetical protein
MKRIYLAPQIGSGTWKDPYRSLLNQFVNIQAGEEFDEVINDARRESLCVVDAS